MSISELTMNENTQFPANPPYDEGLAVLLEERDEEAWKKLLQEVNPQFGNPIAAQVSHIMRYRWNMSGEEVGKLIRKMLVDKAIDDRIDDEDEKVEMAKRAASSQYRDRAEAEAEEDKSSFDTQMAVLKAKINFHQSMYNKVEQEQTERRQKLYELKKKLTKFPPNKKTQ
jgi:hypothetical protein